MSFLFLLSSGLFLGWSLGANDAANVFGTAVGSRMVRFRTAALICGVFIVMGATWGGGGTARTLGRLGEVNALGGAFTVALAAALATFWMTRLKIPVSTSQSIVGAIIGWNFYTARATDSSVLGTIVLTWVACPVVSGLLAVGLYLVCRWWLKRTRIHLLSLDQYTRGGLLVAGAFGSYSLGANNIPNVVSVFVADNPFSGLTVGGLAFSGDQILFFLGGLAIAVGVFTYSERVMTTVGSGVFRLAPIPALLVVLAHSLTLFLFSSQKLENLLASLGLPTIPLVPVSSSQAVIGAILGIGLIKGRRNINTDVLVKIGAGWVATPVLAGLLAYFLLFFVENVFGQRIDLP